MQNQVTSNQSSVQKCPIYGSNLSGFILCRKLVTISSTLSHFCDLFWIGTVKTGVCFIWGFCGQSDNFPPVSPPKNYFWAPQGSTKVQKIPKKNYLKLWLILADSCWLWMTLTLSESGWLWLTLADSGWFFLSLADSNWPWRTLEDCGLLKLTLASSDRLWLTLADSNWLWRTARVIQSQPESSKVIQSQP